MADEKRTGPSLTDVAGTVINGWNAVKGLFTNRRKEEKRQDERQIRQQQLLTDMGVRSGKEMADYEQALKMKMWNDTNYGAQMEHAKAAGLSKMAVLGGNGGGTTAQGASVGSGGTGHAADAAATQQAAIQQQLMTAQIGNINADTELKKSQAGKTGQETTNLQLDEQWKQLENKLAGRTFEQKIELINGELKLQENEIFKTNDEKGILSNTYLERIGEVKAKATQVALQNLAIQQGVKLDQAKINEITTTLKQKWEELAIKKEGQKIDREWIKNSEDNMRMLTETMLQGYYIQGSSNVIGGITDMWKFEQMKKERAAEGAKQTREVVERYNKKGKPVSTTIKKTGRR